MSEKILLTCFTADWCKPCHHLMPELIKINEKYKENTELAVIDVEKQKELALKIGISEIPTVLAVKGDEVISLFSGYMPNEAIDEFIEKVLKKAKV